MAQSATEARASFLRTFKETARYRHSYEVWKDFVTMAACAIHNGLHKDQAREDEYLTTIHRYEPDDQKRFPALMGQLVMMLDEEPRDALGPLYLELELGNKDAGQFFTPPAVSELMARMTFSDELKALDTQPFLTVQEPACGAGGMVLAVARTLIEAGHDPSSRLWVQCLDVDRTAALMCYVQLGLWHVPAQIVVGNTLSLETREVWYTPAHYLGLWDARLASKRQAQPEIDTLRAASPAKRDEPPEQLELF